MALMLGHDINYLAIAGLSLHNTTDFRRIIGKGLFNFVDDQLLGRAGDKPYAPGNLLGFHVSSSR